RARRVVLGQAGDLLEQLAAAGVVEVLRRQPLGRRGQPGPGVGAQCLDPVAVVQVHVEVGVRQCHGETPSNGGMSTVDACATSSEPSGTARHDEESSGSEETVTAGPSIEDRYDSAWPYAVAAIVTPSVSRRLSREPGATVSTSSTTERSASSTVDPLRRRCR